MTCHIKHTQMFIHVLTLFHFQYINKQHQKRIAMMVFINTTLCPYNLFIYRFHRNPNSDQLMQHLLIINSTIQKKKQHAMYTENGPLIAYRRFMMIYLYLPTIADLQIFMMMYRLKIVFSCWFTSTKWWWAYIFQLKFVVFHSKTMSLPAGFGHHLGEGRKGELLTAALDRTAGLLLWRAMDSAS